MVANFEAIKSKEVIHSALQELSNSLKEQQGDIKENFEEDVRDINKLVNISNELISEFSSIQTSEEFAQFFRKNEPFIRIGMESITKRIKENYVDKLNKVKQTLDLAYKSQIEKRDDFTNDRIKDENDFLKGYIDNIIKLIKSTDIKTTRNYIDESKRFESYLERIKFIISDYNKIRSKNDFISFFENIKINEDDSDEIKKITKEWLDSSREKAKNW